MMLKATGLIVDEISRSRITFRVAFIVRHNLIARFSPSYVLLYIRLEKVHVESVL